ncbi:cellulose binding domain-containing protein [Microbispora sp. ATCC PTA-5024]|uniref:cellulose binding domain-containing protein n=1 Tax=Microbispora sp. ATCC PTA-5024 TaxID=316330 RepID=UPI0003DDB7F6|nr:cellulose binding domain-containing protein [Microbispora sp. ATCC PTA-5024]ETK36905.1 alpha-galactosidase [Microbispora sp. ATCC PTA-5024]
MRKVRALLGTGILIGGLVALQDQAGALENGVARTPPMGWNSWNTFGCNISETLIKQMADAIVSSGLRDLGYKYVVVDDCWFNPTRDSAGNLQGNPSRFPSGMKALGDYLHGKGLKFGLYEVPVDKTCAQYFGSYSGATGSQGHEVQDARQFAAWGVDYLKYDWCSPNGTITDQVNTFAKMRDALAASGRQIVYSINPNSIHAKTGPQRNWGDVANMWRTTEDITNKWDTGQTNGYPMGIQNIVNVTVPLASYAKPGAFNDPDMMEIGRGGMNDTEMRSHFALWAMMASPLIAGNDIRSMDAATTTILKNQNLIAVNQDSLAQQARQISNDGTRRVLAKNLSNGDVAVALFNQGGSTTTISTTASAVGLSGGSFTLRDAWTNATSTSTGAITASVPAHGTVVYRVSGGATPSPTPTPTPSPTLTPTPTPTPSPTPSGQPAGCTATYHLVNDWGTGFQAEVTVGNTGSSALNGWTVSMTLNGGQTITSLWNGVNTGTTGAVTVRNASYNGAVAGGGSTTFGFTANGSGSAAPGGITCTSS